MKTLMIERVVNGWIVRPFSPCEGRASATTSPMYVYTTIEDLQRDLPNLLEYATQTN